MCSFQAKTSNPSYRSHLLSPLPPIYFCGIVCSFLPPHPSNLHRAFSSQSLASHSPSHRHSPGSPPHISAASSQDLPDPQSLALSSGYQISALSQARPTLTRQTHCPLPPFSPGFEIRSPPSSTGISRLSPAPDAAEPTLTSAPGNLLLTDWSTPDSVAVGGVVSGGCFVKRRIEDLSR